MISSDALQYASRFAALGHEVRVDIVRLLLAVVVGQLLEELEIPASTLSHHLDALNREGLIIVEREGRFQRYRAGTEALQGILNFLYAECCSRQNVVSISLNRAQSRA